MPEDDFIKETRQLYDFDASAQKFAEQKGTVGPTFSLAPPAGTTRVSRSPVPDCGSRYVDTLTAPSGRTVMATVQRLEGIKAAHEELLQFLALCATQMLETPAAIAPPIGDILFANPTTPISHLAFTRYNVFVALRYADTAECPNESEFLNIARDIDSQLLASVPNCPPEA
jgi:hypothetical protein